MLIRVGIVTAPHIEYEQRENTFLLKNVRIGIGFHWDRYEDQEFAGSLEIRNNPDGTQTAINTLDLEDYLCSVISSEMSANSPMELLKSHAVISRSWAIRAIEKPNHEGYHVCADDHCQRYEGLRRMNERAVQAVRETAGQVLVNSQYTKEEICDCRYYKCCGGRSEIWRTCWEDIDVPYIQSVECPFCGRVSAKTLRLVLNDYDQETKDFHDWKVTYTAEELSDIIREKSGLDFGTVTDLIPLKRGASGRICELKIVGTKRTEIIGKELKIRLWLSHTCLYSSWFEVKKSVSPEDGLSVKRSVSETVCQSEGRSFTLTGHGWGHGAGLCQIGAAQMAEEGFTHEQILAHYYVGTRISVATL
jgi:SpoIID/LytB domain protein